MKVCFLGNINSGHLVRWVNHFAQQGWDVHVISWRPPRNGVIFIKNITIHRLKTPPHYIGLLGALIEIYWLILIIKPSLIHAHYISTYGILAGIIKRLHRKYPVILTAWGSDIFIESKGWKRPLIKHALKQANCITTTSEYMKNHISSVFNIRINKIVCFPWGIDLNIFNDKLEDSATVISKKIGLRANDFVLFSPRNMTPHYRIEAIIAAINHNALTHHDIKLIVLSPSGKKRPYLTSIINDIAKSKNSSNIILIDWRLTAEEMATLFRISQAFISIPKSDQFASSIIEGMACGSIPIVGNLEVYKEHLRDNYNALFVDPENPDDIAKIIIYCIEHPEIKGQFAKINNGIVKEKFNWDTNAAKMENLYNRLIEEKGQYAD